MKLRRYLGFGLAFVVAVVGLFLYPPSASAEMIFKVHGHFESTQGWGYSNPNLSLKPPDRIAIRYQPEIDQLVCTIKLLLDRGTTINDNLTLSMFVNGNMPELGIPMDISAAPEKSVPQIQFVGSEEYTNFNFSPCINLGARTDYWFILTRPEVLDDYGYNYYYKFTDEYENLAAWEHYGDGWVRTPEYLEPMMILEGFNLGHVETKEPIVIVPGITGSKLNRASDGEEVWPNALRMFLSPFDGYLDELKLDGFGKQISGREMNVGDVLNSVSGFDVYNRLVFYFTNQGYRSDVNIFIAPYDWRVDIDDSAVTLAKYIEKALEYSDTGKINIIAHSMGGLLVKEYLAGLDDTSFVNKTIMIGVPQLGAPKAFKALNWGDDFGFKFFGFGLNIKKAQEISQNFPSVYELLPSREYFNQNGNGYVMDLRNGQKTLTYDETDTFLTNDSILPDHRNSYLLELADDFHAQSDSQPISVGNIYNIVGCQNADTVGQFKIYGNGKIDITAVNGDGTVPVISALGGNALSSNTYFILGSETDSEHLGMIKNQNVLVLVYDLIHGELVSSGGNGITQTIGDCYVKSPNPTRVIFSTHSPVTLHLYDQLGNHTGPKDDGDIELGIPDSDYMVLGENHFAFVPAGVEYRVEIDAIDSGNFDFNIKSYNGAVLGETADFLGVPLANNQVKAQLDYTDIHPGMNLEIDSDGNGSFETLKRPDVILADEVVSDIDPPEIQIISPEEKDYLRSKKMGINYTVTDPGSGVDSIKTGLDGSEISTDVNEIDFFYDHLGSHSFEIMATDNAGNSSTKTVEFRVTANPDSTLTDIDRAFLLGWIAKKSVATELSNKLRAAIRIERWLENLEEKAPDGSTIIKKVKKVAVKVDRKLTTILLKDLEKYYNKGVINNSAYLLIKEDLEWLAEKLNEE